MAPRAKASSASGVLRQNSTTIRKEMTTTKVHLKAALLMLGVSTVFSFALLKNGFGAEPAFESPPTFHASEILSKDLIESPHHRVRDEIRNDGYMNHFVIESNFDTYEAVGFPMLSRRIHEINALAILAEHSTTKVAIDTGKNVGTKIATSTIEGTKNLGRRISNPDELGTMVKAIPGGIVNLFRYSAEAVESGTRYVVDSGKEVISGSEQEDETHESKTPEEGGGTSKATGQVTNLALDYTGYNSSRSKWAQQLEIDPYTDNERLLLEIRRVATVETTVGFAGKFAPSVPSIPGVNQANKWLSRFEDISLYDDPAKIAELNEKIMKSLSRNENETKTFANNPNYTPTTRTLFLGALKCLENVDDKAELFALAGTAASRDGAWFYVYTAQELCDFHTQRPLDEIIAAVTLPAGITNDGHLVIPLAIDHLVWTEEVATILEEAHSRANLEHQVKTKEVMVAGSVSGRSRKELEALGFAIHDNLKYE